jgi:hypothetical protein
MDRRSILAEAVRHRVANLGFGRAAQGKGARCRETRRARGGAYVGGGGDKNALSQLCRPRAQGGAVAGGRWRISRRLDRDGDGVACE